MYDEYHCQNAEEDIVCSKSLVEGDSYFGRCDIAIHRGGLATSISLPRDTIEGEISSIVGRWLTMQWLPRQQLRIERHHASIEAQNRGLERILTEESKVD